MKIPAPLPVEKRTVFDASGRGDLGHLPATISETLSCSAGPIRLLRGVEGRSGGFGLAHIESHAGRMRQFESLGYRDAVSFVRFVVSDFDQIIMQEDGRLLFQRESDGVYCQVVCQWDETVQIWSVTTAIPKRAVRNQNVVWKKY
jgi:hypothetical protein